MVGISEGSYDKKPASWNSEFFIHYAEFSILQEAGDSSSEFKWDRFENGVIFDQARGLAEICAKKCGENPASLQV